MNYSYLTQILTSLTMIFSLSTAIGIFMHDTNMDKALISSLNSINKSFDMAADDHRPGSSPHTHSHHGDLLAAIKDANAHPRKNPRSSRRGLSRKISHKVNNSHDNYNIVIDPDASLG